MIRFIATCVVAGVLLGLFIRIVQLGGRVSELENRVTVLEQLSEPGP